MDVTNKKDLIKVFNWYLETRSDRFYEIIKGDPEKVDKKKDIVFNIDNAQLQVTSLAFGRSIYFVLDELIEEFHRKSK